MLSRYKRIGQLTYFDIRNTEEDLIIKEGVTEDPQRKLVSVTAKIEENKNNKNEKCVFTFREITVFEHGEICEQEWNSESEFRRSRIILADGDCVLSFRDKDNLGCGYTVVYSSDGNVWSGETYKNKWHGIRVEAYTDGRRNIGEVFNDKPFGNWKVIEKDGTETIGNL